VSRVIVFVDYQNACRTALETFGRVNSDQVPVQIDPRRLADSVLRLGRPGNELTQVRVYRTVPNGKLDAPAFSAVLRQMESWSNAGVEVVRRPQEDPRASIGEGIDDDIGPKGLAVALAVDLAVMAWRDQYDLAIVVSSDVDLAPGLKAVLDHTWKTIEVASWRNPCSPSQRLRVPRENIPCWWLDSTVFESAYDPTDYTKPLTPQT
jgi:uncharacterized LabA/DUF88 family protein